ncbi:MAG: DUF86 domain-containing protein [Thermodesulfobacteriota bacterium]
MSCEKIQRYIEAKTYNEFIKDELLLDGVIRNLEVIGEATKRVPMSIRRLYPDVEWKKIVGLRDILIHEYFGIDFEILWDIVKNKIPLLNEQLKDILNDLDSKG